MTWVVLDSADSGFVDGLIVTWVSVLDSAATVGLLMGS